MKYTLIVAAALSLSAGSALAQSIPNVTQFGTDRYLTDPAAPYTTPGGTSQNKTYTGPGGTYTTPQRTPGEPRTYTGPAPIITPGGGLGESKSITGPASTESGTTPNGVVGPNRTVTGPAKSYTPAKPGYDRTYTDPAVGTPYPDKPKHNRGF